MTTEKRWREIKETVYQDQGGVCQVCKHPYGIDYLARHHAIYSRDKRFSKFLNSEENIVLLCVKCHGGAKHGRLLHWMRRNMFWTDKIDQGYDMITWHDSIPMLEKDHFIYTKEE